MSKQATRYQDSGDEITQTHDTWSDADAFVKLYQRNAIPAWHVDL